jgi:anti-sigma factor RsiW
MNCNDIQERLDDFLDGELAPALSDELGAHVGECTLCRSRLAHAQMLTSALRQLPVDGPSDGFEERVLQRAAEGSPAKPRAPLFAVGGFAAAVAASVLTIALILAGPSVPSSDNAGEFPVVDVTVDQPQTVNLVFASNSAIDDVSLVVELPEGVEIAGYAGRREVLWRTSMQAGKNVLPLELVARESVSGELVARLQHGDMERTFRIFVSAAAG